MYGFLLNMWIMKKIDEAKVNTYVPRILSQQEAEMILATPQLENYETQAAPSQSV